jgi:hypothetical protein
MSIGDSWVIAGEIYFLGFIIAFGMACLIKLLMVILQRSEKKPAVAAAGAGSESKPAPAIAEAAVAAAPAAPTEKIEGEGK